MDKNNYDGGTFSFTYSAKERAEIKAIREKYCAPEREVDRMTALRRMDLSVTKKAGTAALTVGVIGALIMGAGMSVVMTDIGSVIGLASGLSLWVGIPVGLVGIALVSLAYPIHERIVKKERARIAPEIIRLADELLK